MAGDHKFSNDDKILIKDIVFEHLPCSTNKVCKEVAGVKNLGWGILILTFAILVGLVVNYLEAKDAGARATDNNKLVERRLDKIDVVMGIK